MNLRMRPSSLRFEVDENGCWIWAGAMASDKVYGQCGSVHAHRKVFVFFGGEIPPGYEVDHLCRVPLCVNPKHLEAVTPAENRRRKYAAITECKNGHPYDDANTYIRPVGTRDCRTCIRERVRRYQARKKAAA